MSESKIQNYYRTLKSKNKIYKSKFKSGSRFVKKASLQRREKRDEMKRLATLAIKVREIV